MGVTNYVTARKIIVLVVIQQLASVSVNLNGKVSGVKQNVKKVHMEKTVLKSAIVRTIVLVILRLELVLVLVVGRVQTAVNLAKQVSMALDVRKSVLWFLEVEHVTM